MFGHVMGAASPLGEEIHHDDYQGCVQAVTSAHAADFFALAFDGSLSTLSAHEAAKDLAYDTTFDIDGDLTAVWMDQNYDWRNPAFRGRVQQSINLAVNCVADVLHTLYNEDSSPASTVLLINEVELDPPGPDKGNEWVEVYNPSEAPVNIGGWTLTKQV